jgi:hypothetical protein
MRNALDTRLAPNEYRREVHHPVSRVCPGIHFPFHKGAVMSSKLSMMKTMVVTAALVAGVSGFAQAADNSTKARDFAIQNEYLQDQSTSMPHQSPPVDRSAAPADPIPKASTVGGEAARFRAMDQQLQVESTGMPVGSPPVNRTSVNQDPAPRGLAEEQFLQQNSTK